MLFGCSFSFKHVGLSNNDIVCLYNFIKIFSSFLVSCFQVRIGG